MATEVLKHLLTGLREIELVYIAITATMQDVTEDIRGHVIEAVDMFHDAPERDKQCICQSDDKEEHIAHGLTAQLRHTLLGACRQSRHSFPPRRRQATKAALSMADASRTPKGKRW